MLEVRALHAGYAGAHVLHGVDVRVDAGEIVALLGRNGSGRSTLLKAVMGLVAVRDGDVRLDGRSLKGLAPSRIARAGLAWVPEDRRVFGDLTVDENLRVAAGLTGDARAHAEAFDLFPDLQSRRRQRAAQLSGGQQQMLAIARALAGRPRMLLLDEPSEGLAPAVVAAIRRGILAIRDRGIGVLLVEQNLRLALDVAGRGVILDRGRVVADSDSESLRGQPALLAAHLGVGVTAARP